MTPNAPHASLIDAIGRTPLVPLTCVGRGLPVPLLAKCEHLNPTGSVKDRLALALIEDGERRGLLQPGGTMIEATAGNTGLGLAMIGAIRGYALVCVMPEKMSIDKRLALTAAGAKVVITPNAPLDSPEHFQNVARRMAEENGWFLTDQFASPANARVHEQVTGPEILSQTGGVIGAFVAGAGTGGTITGVGRCLREHAPHARVVLADPIGSGLAHWVEHGVPGTDAAYQIEGIGTSRPPVIMDRSVIDAAESVSDDESFAMTRRLWAEEGQFVGGSSGTAVVAAIRVARRSPPGPVIVLLADAWDRYRSKEWAQVRPAP